MVIIHTCLQKKVKIIYIDNILDINISIRYNLTIMTKKSNNQHRRFHHVPGTDPYMHQRTRDVQPQTKEDTKFLRRVLAIGAASTTLLIGANVLTNDNSVEGVPKQPSTTVVVAESGDSYFSLQKAEGANGDDIRDVVATAMELPANDNNNDGEADMIHPGDAVHLIDDPNTPHQP